MPISISSRTSSLSSDAAFMKSPGSRINSPVYYLHNARSGIGRLTSVALSMGHVRLPYVTRTRYPMLMHILTEQQTLDTLHINLQVYTMQMIQNSSVRLFLDRGRHASYTASAVGWGISISICKYYILIRYCDVERLRMLCVPFRMQCVCDVC